MLVSVFAKRVKNGRFVCSYNPHFAQKQVIMYGAKHLVEARKYETYLKAEWLIC